MKKFACQYALLRFRPFVETGEFANVGVVLMAAEAGFFGFRLLKRYRRITQFFQLDHKLYADGRGLFREELERFTALLQHEALGPDRPAPDLKLATNLFNELVRPREAILQFDDQRIALAADPKAKLDALYDYYCERNFVTRAYQERQLENEMRQLLARAQVLGEYRKEPIGGPDFLVHFPFVRMRAGKAERVIKPLHLDQDEPTKVLTHGGPWVDKVRRLRKRDALPQDVLFPVTGPQAGTAPYAAFEEIKADLLSIGVRVVPANDDAAILEFAVA